MLLFVSTTGLARPGSLVLQRHKDQELILHGAEGARREYAVVAYGSCGFSQQAPLEKSTGASTLILTRHQDCCEHIWASQPDWMVGRNKTWEFCHQFQWDTDRGGILSCIYLQ